jgi:hypothetical protein
MPGRTTAAEHRWHRIGAATVLTDRPPGANAGWEWCIRRNQNDDRVIRVEVLGDFTRPTDLSEESRRAIRTRGASAIDAFLDLDDPPSLIVISHSLLHTRT